jgi:hypothetical protein
MSLLEYLQCQLHRRDLTRTVHATAGLQARIAVERGIQSGHFVVADLEVLLTAVIGGAFALIREILDGRHGTHAHEAFARHVLAALGVSPVEAEAIVSKVAKGEAK